MPIVPANFRQGAAFQPLDSASDIIKFDGVVAAAQGRIQDGTWVQWTATGVQKPAGVVQGIKSAFCAFSDFDQNDIIGHPDASRLGQVTLLVGQYRGRTLYWQRGGTMPAPGLFAEVDVASAVGATVAAIVADAGVADAVVGTDGILDVQGGGVTADQAVAVILTAPSGGTTGFVEYMML